MQRRDLLRTGGFAGIAMLSGRAFAQTGAAGDTLVPWSDQPPPVPPPLENVAKGLTRWEDLDSWITPNSKFFSIAHYNRPQIDAKTWRLDVSGQVGQPTTLLLDQLKAQQVTFTIECSGNNGLPFVTSAIGNARWGGTPLAEVLRNAGIKSSALEVVFFGADSGEETVRKDTPLEFKYTSNFARSIPVADAMNPANLLCYEMNGSPLPAANGFPCRLIVPGWYGVANVKWLTRIEVRDQRFLGRFMGRDYVTIREERHGDKTVMAETSVGRMLLKSAPGKVVQHGGRHQIDGMAWGPRPIAAVDVKIDDGAWTKATLGESEGEFAWRSWRLDWSPTPGEHTITSRAIDVAGNTQPTMDDPSIANKKTYWESNGQIMRHIRIA